MKWRHSKTTITTWHRMKHRMKLSNVTIAQATLTVSLLSMCLSSPEVVPIDHSFTRVRPLAVCRSKSKTILLLFNHDPLLGYKNHKSHVCLLWALVLGMQTGSLHRIASVGTLCVKMLVKHKAA
ncbi:unnamed protein product [Cladocopium goreaui]|uniref:Uncharacterized protein n=1 Tax=Cladocopium goreaui TaxID=2562237 RepID=A0A9P1G9U2_9DINO|nr:unnamed protein product [Cladocopium goreaui]